MSEKSRYQIKFESIKIDKLNIKLEKYTLIDNLKNMFLEIIPSLGSNIVGFYQKIKNKRKDFIHISNNIETLITKKNSFLWKSYSISIS
ncbi:MAG: hypothetical protein ACTSO9_06970 [Candidatus Helarchaeota archaeon]